MTAEELVEAEARYQRAHAARETARKERNATFIQAIREGWTHAKIAQATGLTRSRIGKIGKP